MGSDLGNAANWSDATNSLNPALLAPDAADSAAFASGGGSITGTATVAALSFGGGNVWNLASGAALTSLGTTDVGVGGFAMLAISAGSTLTAGALDLAADNDGLIAIEGAGSDLTVGGQLAVGSAASAELSILNGGSVAAAKFLVNAFNNGASLQRIGKKERAMLAAKSAAEGTEWEGLIAFPQRHDGQE